MGALQGTLTYKLFYVQGELADNWQEDIVDKIRHRAFEPLDPDSDEEERYGWVPIETPLKVEFELHKVLFDHFLNLGLRQDKYVIPSTLLKAHLEEAERAYMQENAKERLSKFEREDIRDMVRKQLKRLMLPRMGVIDMSWDLQNKRVRFWSQSNKSCELFQGMFEDTFGLKILPANPYIDALQLELAPDLVAKLAEVDPANFLGAHIPQG
jgi:DNA recombination-dependent growth factor C